MLLEFRWPGPVCYLKVQFYGNYIIPVKYDLLVMTQQVINPLLLPGPRSGATKEQGTRKGWQRRREEARKNCCLFIFVSIKPRHVKAFFKLHRYSRQALLDLESSSPQLCDPAARTGRCGIGTGTLRVRTQRTRREIGNPAAPASRAPAQRARPSLGQDQDERPTRCSASAATSEPTPQSNVFPRGHRVD